MKDIILTIITVLTLFAAGCSHNADFVASGKIFRIGNESANILFVNGFVAFSGMRENGESIIETGDDDGVSGAPTVDSKTLRAIRFRTGPQVTGYLVDLAKKNPDAATAYVKQMYKLNTAAWDSKETLEGKSTTHKEGEKTSTSDYISYLKDKLKSIAGGDAGKQTIKGDGEYTELYKDNSITAQAALTSELLSKCDSETLIKEDCQTIQETLVHYAGRLASLKAKGKTESKRVILNKATIKGGKVTFLRYRLCDAKTGYVEREDEVCPNCYGLED